jgi:hypothetical protein
MSKGMEPSFQQALLKWALNHLTSQTQGFVNPRGLSANIVHAYIHVELIALFERVAVLQLAAGRCGHSVNDGDVKSASPELESLMYIL